ncbi:MAG: murein biosynthesis integral membrane protein MurJ [Pseudomonadota bacterium]|jgi:putative peptidoglycan lipid II flippase|nr:MAG: murein biosynthesis integral membrane protein MurJ [Pseudomonadota bacterium]
MSRPLLKSTGSTGAATLLSRITGLVRDALMAQILGGGAASDAFFAAFKIPNFMRRLFAEGAFSQAFVPVITEYRTQRPRHEVRELVAGVAGTHGAVLLALSALGVLVAPVIILLYAPGFTADSRYELTVQMLRWTFPFLFFISMTSLLAGVLNSYGRFFVPAFAQVVMNLVLIGAAAWFAPGSDNPGLVMAMAVFISGAAQVLFQLPGVARLGLLSWPRWKPRMEGVVRIAKLMVPGIVGSSAAQISLLLDTVIVSLLVEGSLTWLYYADRLMEFPLGVFSIALGTVILPALSANHATRSMEQFSATIDWALRLVVVLVTPAAVGMLCFAVPMVALIYGYREFDLEDIEHTSYALMAYSWGLVAFSLVKVLVPGYYARQDTKRPMRIAITAMVVTMAINVLVVLPAAKLGFPQPHVLIATATCVGGLVNTLLLWRGLTGEGVLVLSRGWKVLLLRVLLASAAMGALLVWLAGDAGRWTTMSFVERLWRCGGGIVGAAILYFVVLALLGMRPGHLRTVPR